jgi:hypothetical protein
MRLNDYKKDFYEFSAKASETTRAVAFGGIAIIWVFRITTEASPQIPRDLILPTVLFAIALLFDLLHYIVGAMIWGIFHRINEKKMRKPTNNPLLAHSPYLNLFIWTFFILKIACVLAGYFTLISYIWPLWLMSTTS